MAGLGPNRLLARLATKRAKPDGLHAIRSVSAGAALIAAEPVSTLPGVGAKLSAKLRGIGITTCAELRSAPPSRLAAGVGAKVAATLGSFAGGADTREWEERATRKTIGAQASWGVRFDTEAQVTISANYLSRMTTISAN